MMLYLLNHPKQLSELKKLRKKFLQDFQNLDCNEAFLLADVSYWYGPTIDVTNPIVLIMSVSLFHRVKVISGKKKESRHWDQRTTVELLNC